MSGLWSVGLRPERDKKPTLDQRFDPAAARLADKSAAHKGSLPSTVKSAGAVPALSRGLPPPKALQTGSDLARSIAARALRGKSAGGSSAFALPHRGSSTTRGAITQSQPSEEDDSDEEEAAVRTPDTPPKGAAPAAASRNEEVRASARLAVTTASSAPAGRPVRGESTYDFMVKHFEVEGGGARRASSAPAPAPSPPAAPQIDDTWDAVLQDAVPAPTAAAPTAAAAPAPRVAAAPVPAAAPAPVAAEAEAKRRGGKEEAVVPMPAPAPAPPAPAVVLTAVQPPPAPAADAVAPAAKAEKGEKGAPAKDALEGRAAPAVAEAAPPAVAAAGAAPRPAPRKRQRPAEESEDEGSGSASAPPPAAPVPSAKAAAKGSKQRAKAPAPRAVEEEEGEKMGCEEEGGGLFASYREEGGEEEGSYSLSFMDQGLPDIDYYLGGAGAGAGAKAGAGEGAGAGAAAPFQPLTVRAWDGVPWTEGAEEWLHANYPGRDDAVHSLRATFTAAHPTGLSDFLILSGRSRTGKSAAMRAVLDESGLPRVEVRCCDMRNTRELFETTLRGLARAVLGMAGRAHTDAGWTGAAEGLRNLDPAYLPQSWQGWPKAGIKALVRRICMPEYPAGTPKEVIHERAGDMSGLATCAALARWGDDAACTVRDAFVKSFNEVAAYSGKASSVSSKQISKFIGSAHASSLLDLIRELRALARVGLADVGGCSVEEGNEGVALTMVFDRAERLAVAEPALLKQFMRLRELTGAVNLNLVFVTDARIALHDALAEELVGGVPLISLRWPMAPPDAVPGVLASLLGGLQRPGGPLAALPPALFPAFMQRLSVAFGPVTGWDVPELCYLGQHLAPVWAYASSRFGITGEGIADGKDMERATLPAFDLMRSRILQRDVPALNPAALVTQAGAAPLTVYPFATRERNVALELPWFTKFLLIAAYVGSHNPPDTDVRYLTRHASGKAKKRRVGAGAGAGAPAPTLAGPRPCRHARLLAITHALVSMFDSAAASAKVSENSLLESLNGLMDMRMVARADAPVRGAMVPGTTDRRYVCYAPLRTVAAVATTVKVDLGIVLHDPAV